MASARKPQRERAVLLLHGRPELEDLWVEKLKGRSYEVGSIPFFAYNLSRGDTVRCAPDDDGVGLFVDAVVRKSGNRTLRVGFVGGGNLEHPEAVKLRAYLKRAGLAYEVFPPCLLAINVPPAFDLARLVARLEKIVAADTERQWEEGDPNPRRNLDGTRRETPKQLRRGRRRGTPRS